ncbi:MAG TPA: HD domain-containing protein [Candidatus Paceibacterota bacterium]|nr:HD domain-containing protein [Candidatus Paceibacterota bacterium]
MRLLHTFQSVQRVMFAPDLARKENDVEHSYTLTLLCWYLNDSLELGLDTNKLLEYGLVHDFVEVYAGDTYVFDQKRKETKHRREEEARLRIAREFPEFKSLHESIEQYESRGSPEALFVYAVDKLVPMLTNYLQKGHAWKEMKVPRKELYALKRETIQSQEQVRELLEQLIREIEPHWNEFFDA